MPKYVSLFTYTGAIEGGGPERFGTVQQIVAAENGEIHAVYGLLGAYDIVSVVECPDDRTAWSARIPSTSAIAAAKGGIGVHESVQPAIHRSMASDCGWSTVGPRRRGLGSLFVTKVAAAPGVATTPSTAQGSRPAPRLASSGSWRRSSCRSLPRSS
jgi:uncharacterized protein with GYD domain